METRDRRRRDQRHLVDVLVTAGLVPADAARDALADMIYALLNEDVFLLLTRDCGWTVERVRAWVTVTLLDHLRAVDGRRSTGDA